MLLYLIREKFARFYQLLSQQINPLTSCNAVSENGRGTGGEERKTKKREWMSKKDNWVKNKQDKKKASSEYNFVEKSGFKLVFASLR